MDTENVNVENGGSSSEDITVKKKTRTKSKKTIELVKECKVLEYCEKLKTLDVLFDDYGIRINNVNDFHDSLTVTVKYTGEIGKSDFYCELYGV